MPGGCKRATPARLALRDAPSHALQRAYATLTAGSRPTPSRLACHLAPMFAPHAAMAYLAVVGCAALPLPALDAASCEVPKGYLNAMRSPHADHWREAIHKEWSGIMANDTLDFVRRCDIPAGSNVMNSHFVFDVKPNPDGSIEKFKARLVADGNTQQYGGDFDQIFATVVNLGTIRFLLTLAALHGWRLWQLDVKQAFLQEICLECIQNIVRKKVGKLI